MDILRRFFANPSFNLMASRRGQMAEPIGREPEKLAEQT
jgi:hypothetical protein